MQDVNCTSTYGRVSDVHDVYGLTGEGQDVVQDLHLVTVQLSGGGRGGQVGGGA